MSSEIVQEIWVYFGIRAKGPTACFSTQQKAIEWIARHKVSGDLYILSLDHPKIDVLLSESSRRPAWCRDIDFDSSEANTLREEYTDGKDVFNVLDGYVQCQPGFYEAIMRRDNRQAADNGDGSSGKPIGG